ncbi:FliI/YscN family ATPase [Timonella sp. A28]|uniref:FliI/YscN family ATPase n=1 Tax=Timonella sp. A28 TaxID=3442640 RepID=UPI003EBEA2A9
MNTAWQKIYDAAAPRRVGRLRKAVGLSVEISGLTCSVGDVLHVTPHSRSHSPHHTDHAHVMEVVAVTRDVARCMPLTTSVGLRPGLDVHHTGGPLLIPTGPGLLGRVLDGLGRPIDDKGPLTNVTYTPLRSGVPHPLSRQRITTPLATSVRTLDTLTTLGKGQRIGLFAGSGVGKSTLLSMVARGTDAAINVIALVGERGREVREFLEDDLGPEGLARSVVVVATSDQPALVRAKSAFVATAIAHEYRDQGNDVVLMMDSLTRVAMAQREIGLSVGEPPATRGYPPSTFAVLADLLEQAGSAERGSVTGIYTVLVDGDDHNEPIADAARSILDGHVVLDRKLAIRGHYPSIDALGSISRVASKVLTEQQKNDAAALRRFMAAQAQVQDLIDVGAYVSGSNPDADAALAFGAHISQFLTQAVHETADFTQAWTALHHLVRALENHTAQARTTEG